MSVLSFDNKRLDDIIMNEKDVMITLNTKQSDGLNSEHMEIITEGKYNKFKDGYIISYKDSEATGFNGSSTVLKATQSNKVEIERTGTSQSQIIIEKANKHHCHYGTPYGAVMIGVTAREIKSCLNDNGGDLFFKYVIDINSSFISDYEVNINVKLS